MVEVFRAKSGDLTASAAGVLLHSRYDPVREARRLVATSISEEQPAVVLLLGTGLGYIATAVREAHPLARIIAISPLGLAREELVRSADVYVSATEGIHNASASMRGAIRPEDVAGLQLLEWEPELRAAGETAGTLRTLLREIVSERNADIATTEFFGARYIRNAVRAGLFAERVYRPAPPRRPVCIAASGPSLEESLEWVKQHRTDIELWALASSYPALNARGVTPDRIVHQDAGYYAGEHLRSPARASAAGLSGGRNAVSVLMPATAMLPPPALRDRIELFNQSTPVEDDLLAALGISAPRIAETGTVAATALSLALALSSWPVYVAGLDLARRDIRSHARPHAFEHYLWERESRLRPAFSAVCLETFEHSRELSPAGDVRYRSGRSLEAYAAWFRRLPEAARNRLRRLNPSPVDLGLPEAEPGASRKPTGGGSESLQPPTPRSGAGYAAVELPPPSERATRILAVLRRWRAAVSRVTEAAGSPEWKEGRPGVGADSADEAYVLCYLISASDYVSAVAAARRDDTAARRASLERLSERANTLFARLEDVIRNAERSGGRR
jgi:hypothetical protein